MSGGEGDCCVVVVGAGAGGTLTAAHLLTGLSSRFRVELVDPFGGLQDLRHRRLRMVSERAFASDPLRTIRLARCMSHPQLSAPR